MCFQVSKGLRYPSDCVASRYTEEHFAATEDDILHIRELNALQFDRTLTQSDIERMLSILTVPYLRCPLMLNFFAAEERVHALQHDKLRNILESTIFEPGAWLGVDLAKEVPTTVPASNRDCLGTPFSHLLAELCASPEAVLEPLVRLNEACRRLTGGRYTEAPLQGDTLVDGATFDASYAPIIRFIARVSCRMLDTAVYCVEQRDNDTLRWSGVYGRRLDDSVVSTLRAYIRQIRAQHTDIFRPTFRGWLDEMKASIRINKDLLDATTTLMNNVHAHTVLICTGLFDPIHTKFGQREDSRTDQRPFDLAPLTTFAARDVVGDLMVSTMWLATRFTWNRRKNARDAEQDRTCAIRIVLSIQSPALSLVPLAPSSVRGAHNGGGDHPTLLQGLVLIFLKLSSLSECTRQGWRSQDGWTPRARHQQQVAI
jgi:hypothetical protein